MARSFGCAARRCALPIIFIVLGINASHASDFRIETKIYVGDEKEPASTATTLFVDSAVYDFITEPEQIAVFRKPVAEKPGRFILLDPERQIKTEFTTVQLSGAMEKLRSWAGQQNDPFLRFAANPNFDERFESGSGKLVLANYLETYTVTTRRDDHPQAVAQYREFLDWYTRLNTLLTAGPPPEPRLRLNAALARHKVIPFKVELARNGEKQTLRAEHQFAWRLSEDDRERINDIGTSITSYRAVANDEFLKTTRATMSEE